jgi:hypothetical protein
VLSLCADRGAASTNAGAGSGRLREQDWRHHQVLFSTALLSESPSRGVSRLCASLLLLLGCMHCSAGMILYCLRCSRPAVASVTAPLRLGFSPSCNALVAAQRAQAAAGRAAALNADAHGARSRAGRAPRLTMHARTQHSAARTRGKLTGRQGTTAHDARTYSALSSTPKGQAPGPDESRMRDTLTQQHHQGPSPRAGRAPRAHSADRSLHIPATGAAGLKQTWPREAWATGRTERGSGQEGQVR